jgi:anti-sigma-K factor RskA
LQLTDLQSPHPSELLAEFALGVLSESEAARVRAYIADDPDALAEVEEMLRVARLLPFAAEDREPSADLRAGVMERIAREPVAMPAAIPANVVPITRRRSWLMPVGAAAAALLILAAGIGGFAIGKSGNDDGGSDLRADAVRQDSMLAAVALGQAETASAQDGALRVSVVSARGRSDAYTYVEGMPELPDGKAYQAWFTKDGKAFEAGPVFDTGSGSVWLSSSDALDDYAAMAFTVEDDKGVQQPTQAPFVIVPLEKTARR